MTHYMPQDLFNGVVLTLALARHTARLDMAAAKSMKNKMLLPYLRFYVGDNFLPEANDCAAKTLAWLRDIEEDRDSQTAWLATLIKAVYHHQPTGKRKPWRLFNGLWRSPRSPVLDRTPTYFKDLASYHMQIKLGNISV